MSVRAKVDKLYHKLNPSWLMPEWIAFIREMDAVCGHLDPHHKPLTDKEVVEAARDGARTGKRPGDVLAQTLVGAVRESLAQRDAR